MLKTMSLLLATVAAFLAAGCMSVNSGAPQELGVRRVWAQVKGNTCPACSATMEVELRRQLEGCGKITISQSQQTAEVEFEGGDHAFPPEVFRQAIGKAGVEVLSMEMDACGRVEGSGDSQLWLNTGVNRFALAGEKSIPDRGAVCVSGKLDDSVRPPRIEVAKLRVIAN
jgi:hypothetical protein